MANTDADSKKNLSFEEGWPVLQEAINKIIDSIEGVHDHQVLPHLRGKNGENLLKEIVRQWGKYKIMKRWLSRFFHYLDRYFTRLKKLPSLEQTSHLVFYKLVYGEMNDQVRDAVISTIDREREGEQIDQALVKSVLEMYVEMAEGSVKYYEKDFEAAMLTDTAQFYSQKASGWIIITDSYKTYMLKVEDCLQQEKAKVTSYLRPRTIRKLLEVVEHELLTVHASKLEEMKQIDEKAA